MKSLMSIIQLIYAGYLQNKGKYIKAYTIFQSITQRVGVETSIKGTAYLKMVELLQDLDSGIIDECFNEIDTIVKDNKNLSLLNNIDFILAVSFLYYTHVIRHIENIRREKIDEWMSLANRFKNRAEKIDPQNKNIVSVAIAYLNICLLEKKYLEVLETCNKISVFNFNEEQKIIILYYKGRALMETNQIEDAYNIYKEIISSYSDAIPNYLHYKFFIHYDLGIYFKKKGELKMSKHSFENSFEVLPKLDFDKETREQWEKRIMKNLQNLNL